MNFSCTEIKCTHCHCILLLSKILHIDIITPMETFVNRISKNSFTQKKSAHIMQTLFIKTNINKEFTPALSSHNTPQAPLMLRLPRTSHRPRAQLPSRSQYRGYYTVQRTRKVRYHGIRRQPVPYPSYRQR